MNLTYDALGRMVEQNRSGTHTQIVYSPNGAKFALMNGSALQKAFVPLPGGGQAVYSSSGLLYYGHSDHLGSVRLGSTSTRTVVFDLAYAPFGETYATSGSTDPAFTTQRQDTVVNIYDFPAREYNNFGRWPSPDPSGLSAVDSSDPQTLNRYAYVRNNPLGSVDPSGLYQQCKDGCPQLKPGPVMCVNDDCSSGGVSYSADMDAFFDEMGYDAMGYDEFDAIEGAPGTYISYSIYGRVGFGFDYGLYAETQNFTDANPFFRGSSALQVTVQNLGVDQVTSGLVPEYVALMQERSQLFGELPKRFADDMGAEQDKLVALGVDPGLALMQAQAFEVAQMQTWFGSEPDTANWLSSWQGFMQDAAAWQNRWSSAFPNIP